MWLGVCRPASEPMGAAHLPNPEEESSVHPTHSSSGKPVGQSRGRSGFQEDKANNDLANMVRVLASCPTLC